ncbi:MAG: hypothetical protein ACLQIB_11500 [Isosphaeraceae bacterium]
MSLAYSPDRLKLPEALEAQLHEFRRRVWAIKIVEAVAAAAFSLLVGYLVLFCVDRLWDTPVWLRAVLFMAALLGCVNLPVALHRWVWRHRRLEQLARLLSRKHPSVGDQLLGIIELSHNEFEQARSPALCEAAIRDVASVAQKRDFRDAVPDPRHRMWGYLLSVPLAIALGLIVLVPAAASNTWSRFLAPWKDTPRYTFAMLKHLPDKLVVAHGEPFAVAADLEDQTVWRPRQGSVQLGGQRPIVAGLADGRYQFELPSQIDPGWLYVKIGDFRSRLHVEPTLRPELTAVSAAVKLPEYLGRTKIQKKDVRGGSVSLVQGSEATFAATATRDLASARIDGKPQPPAGATVTSPSTAIRGSRKMEFSWQDKFGLAGKEPFVLSITARDDEAPSLSCENLPRQRVILDTELLSFKVRAQDDYGIKRIGMEWQGSDDPVVKTPAQGELILAGGGHDKESLDISGTFSAKSLGIEPQPVNLRLFAEDYFPGRPRVYTPPYLFYVLNAEQHAIWLTEQLSKWHRHALEVRDRELQLHETNKQLRGLPAEELDRPETRRHIENQAAGERANGRRLSGLVVSGEDLIRQAMRNPEFAIGHLEKWAEMLQILKDIAGNRMPSVADLLKQAATAPNVAANASNNKTKMAGQVRASQASTPSEPKEGPKKPPSGIPAIVDRESSQQPPDEKAGQAAAKKGNSSPKFSFPVTTLDGKPSDKPQPEAPAAQQLEEAVRKQQDLLAEFDKIADELNRVLANLEGSTLVKRLKAASRLQYKIGGRVSDQLSDAFGAAAHQLKAGAVKVLSEMSDQEGKASTDVSYIMDDMAAYFERRGFMRFKTVLDEMRVLDAVGSLRQIGDDVKKESGISIAQCDFWSDTLDRWAEDLVDPAKGGTCNAKSRSSLPPALVLEALQILEAEVNLREETRVTEQAKSATAAEKHKEQALKLAETQNGLGERTDKLSQKISELPDADTEFAYELALLARVSEVMGEAAEILARPETGSPAIAAETEVIELLLQSKRINPKGGGGGGSTPGGGGHGTTHDSALALLGGGVNEKEVREDHGVSQTTGDAGPSLPEEFRAGLDEYFNRLERGSGGQ